MIRLLHLALAESIIFSNFTRNLVETAYLRNLKGYDSFGYDSAKVELQEGILASDSGAPEAVVLLALHLPLGLSKMADEFSMFLCGHHRTGFCTNACHWDLSQQQ